MFDLFDARSLLFSTASFRKPTKLLYCYLHYVHVSRVKYLYNQIGQSIVNIIDILTLPIPIAVDEKKLNFYFHTSLWRLKSFYEGLKVLNFPTENLPSSSLRLTYLTKPFIQQFKHFLLAISYLYTGEILLFLLKAFRVIKHSKCCINSFRATGHFLYTP